MQLEIQWRKGGGQYWIKYKYKASWIKYKYKVSWIKYKYKITRISLNLKYVGLSLNIKYLGLSSDLKLILDKQQHALDKQKVSLELIDKLKLLQIKKHRI